MQRAHARGLGHPSRYIAPPLCFRDLNSASDVTAINECRLTAEHLWARSLPWVSLNPNLVVIF